MGVLQFVVFVGNHGPTMVATFPGNCPLLAGDGIVTLA
jgi:hypothetical protein